MMQPNRYGGACAVCSTYVAPQQGVCRSERGQWTVYCTAHKTAEPQPVSASAVVDEDEAPRVEVRVTGSLAQCQVVKEALQTAAGVTVASTSAPHPRRDEDDDRVSVYLRAEITPAVLAQVERELTP